MTDGWFPPRDIFNQGNENLGEVLEGVVSGLLSGSQRKLHAIPKDEDTQAGGDTYLTQDQQNPERERGVGRMVGRRVDPLHRRRFDLYVNRRWRPMSASAQPVVLLFHPVVTILEIWCISRQRCLLSCSRGITFDPARFAKS